MGRLGKEDRRKWASRKVGQEDKQKKGLRERKRMGWGWEEKRIERESLPSVTRRLGRGLRERFNGGGGGRHS